MNTHPAYLKRSARCEAFTLIEAMLALAISAVVLAAVGGVFYSAMRLRDRTVASLEAVSGVHPALTVIRRDLRGLVWPGGIMTGTFRCGALDSQFGGANGLQFSTTTAMLNENEPYGEIQEVIYELRDSTTAGRRGSKDLLRSVNRNLLTALTETPQEEVLLSGVQNLELTCYNGNAWVSTWDTSLTETNLPAAVRVQIEMAEEEGAGGTTDAEARTYELMVPVVVQSATNVVSSTNETTTATTEEVNQ